MAIVERPLRRRVRLPGIRRRRVAVRLSEDEYAVVRGAAAASGLAVGAWIGDLVARVGGRAEWGLAMERREVVRQLVRVQLDLALADRILREVDGGDVRTLVTAALRRVDELVDGAVENAGR